MTDKNFGFVHVDAGMGKKASLNIWLFSSQVKNINILIAAERRLIKKVFFPGRGKINDLLRELHGAELNGNKLRVQLSTSGVRQSPGMGGDECFK